MQIKDKSITQEKYWFPAFQNELADDGFIGLQRLQRNGGNKKNWRKDKKLVGKE